MALDYNASTGLKEIAKTSLLGFEKNRPTFTKNVSDMGLSDTKTVSNIEGVEFKDGQVNVILKSDAMARLRYGGREHDNVVEKQREAFMKTRDQVMLKFGKIYEEGDNIRVDTRRILENRGHEAKYENINKYLHGVNSKRYNHIPKNIRKDMVGNKNDFESHLERMDAYLGQPGIIDAINSEAFAPERAKLVAGFNEMINDPIVGDVFIEKMGKNLEKIHGMDLARLQGYQKGQQEMAQSSGTLSIDETASKLFCGMAVEQNKANGEEIFVTYVQDGQKIGKYGLGKRPENIYSNMMTTARNIVMNAKDMEKPMMTYVLGQDTQKDAALLTRMAEAQKDVQTAVEMVSQGTKGEISVNASFTASVANCVKNLYHRRLAQNNEQNQGFKLAMQQQQNVPKDLGQSR